MSFQSGNDAAQESRVSIFKRAGRFTAGIAAVALIALAVSCGGSDNSHHYPSGAKKNFMKGCTGNGGDESTCACAYKAIEARFTFKEFAAIEKSLTTGSDPSSKGLPVEVMQTIVTSCLS